MNKNAYTLQFFIVLLNLGQNLATLEGILVITHLLKRYKFSLVPDQKVTYALSLTLQMRYGMKVYISKR